MLPQLNQKASLQNDRQTNYAVQFWQLRNEPCEHCFASYATLLGVLIFHAQCSHSQNSKRCPFSLQSAEPSWSFVNMILCGLHETGGHRMSGPRPRQRQFPRELYWPQGCKDVSHQTAPPDFKIGHKLFSGNKL